MMASLLTGNKFEPKSDIPDLSGKVMSQPQFTILLFPKLTEFEVYVVTGGSAGIGFGIVAHLLDHNAAKILLLSNKKQHAQEAMEELKEFGDPSRVHWMQCDLSDLKQTQEVAKKLAAEEKQIDAVCYRLAFIHGDRHGELLILVVAAHLQRRPRRG